MQLAIVNNTDITRYIDKDSYQMNSNDVYVSWENGNFVEKRIPIRTRVEGSFTIRCGKGLTLESFLTNWNNAVRNKVITINLFVQNINGNETIEAFYSFEGERHVELDNGAFYDELTVKIREC